MLKRRNKIQVGHLDVPVVEQDVPVVEQGKSWVDGGANESRLCAFLTRLRHHLELSHLVRVKLEHLEVFKFNSILIIFFRAAIQINC